MHIFEGNDLTDVTDKLTSFLVYQKPDLITSSDLHIFDVLAQADSCAYELDLKQLWLTPARWSALIHQYIDPEAYLDWLEGIQDAFSTPKRGIAFMRMNEVAVRQSNSGKQWRRWGACMLGLSFRMLPRPQLTLRSRTSYIGYLGFLDIAVVHVIARSVARMVGISPEDIAFSWHLESASYHPLKSLGWFYRDDETREDLEGDLASRQESPGLYLSQKEIRRIWNADTLGTPYGKTAYAPFIRLRRRYHTEVMGWDYGEQFEGGGGRRPDTHNLCRRAKPLPSVPVSDLSLGTLFA